MKKEYIKEAFKLQEEYLFEMANVVKSKSGLDVDIWSEHRGVERHTNHSKPRIKLSKGETSIVISISDNPQIIAKPKKVSVDKANRIFSQGIKYVKDNYDIFLKHYNDKDDSFDDEALFAALRERGVYK